MPERFCYDFPRPQVTVDLVVFGHVDAKLKTLLIRRGRDPFAGKWAIPGGFLEMDEPEANAARRELKEETGLELAGPIEPIGFFGRPGRDPRGRTITLAFAGTIKAGEHRVLGKDDATEAAWIAQDEPVELAFDHAEILVVARRWLERRLMESHGELELFPEAFTLDDVVAVFRPLPCGIDLAFCWIAERLCYGQIVTEPGASGRFRRTAAVG